MNKVEEQARKIQGKDRFEKRENLANWLLAFWKKDHDCEGVLIKRVNIPNNEFLQMVYFQAYSKSYVWIDYVRDNLLDSSRLEFIDKDMEAHILFEDDFGITPAFNIFVDLAMIFGMVDVP